MSGLKSIKDDFVQSALHEAFTSKLFPSPEAWEDNVLYFMLPDRFSDLKEYGYKDTNGQFDRSGTTPLFTEAMRDSAVRTEPEKQQWYEAGRRFTGGTIKGLMSKLGYLKRLGVTAIWIGPVFKQPASSQNYHGYGIQNFLDIEPRFGTRDELQHLVRTAHGVGIYIILDIILNHCADVFAYDTDSQPRYTGEVFPVKGFWDAARNPTISMTDGPVDLVKFPDAYPDGAIWPAELQPRDTFDRKGAIADDQWDSFPAYIEGDFFSLKDIQLGPPGADASFKPTPALQTLVEIYKFWIAYLDIDGFRIDTVKHMGDGPTRFFCSQIHEFAHACGKKNFYLIGEIAGDHTFQTVEVTGLDAALGIGQVQQTLWQIPKGLCNPNEYFALFRNSRYLQKGTHAWLRDKIVTMLDDHDQIWRGNDKARFCAREDPRVAVKRVVAAMALNLFTLGIPCIYYGTEQAFDGGGDADTSLRECMFGGAYGAFRSKGRHFFSETAPAYASVAQMCAIRRGEEALRRGRQYLREISGNGTQWGLPAKGDKVMTSVVPWSRVFHDREYLCAINTDSGAEQTAYVTVDSWINPSGATLGLLYASETGLGLPDVLDVTNVEGRSVVKLTIPPCGFVIYS